MELILVKVTHKCVASMARASSEKFPSATRNLSSVTFPRTIFKTRKEKISHDKNSCSDRKSNIEATKEEKEKEIERELKERVEIRKMSCRDYLLNSKVRMYTRCFNNVYVPKAVFNRHNFGGMPNIQYLQFDRLGRNSFSSSAEKVKIINTNQLEEKNDAQNTNEIFIKAALDREGTLHNNVLDKGKPQNTKNPAEQAQEKTKNEVNEKSEKDIEGVINKEKQKHTVIKNKGNNQKHIKKVYEITVYITKSSFSFLKKFCQITKKIILKPSLLVEYYHNAIKNIKHTLVWVKTGILLFLTNMKISKNLIIKRLKGYRLSYSEYKLLIRTMNDMLKLIPFSFFIIIPFAEFLLPVFLKIYPNLLPSTFKNDNNFNNIKKNLYAKQQLAKFLQKLIEEKEKQLNENINVDMDSDKKISILNKFHQQLINKDAKDINPFLSVNDTLKIAKLFKEDFVLDKMNLKTLQAICHLLDLKPYGMHYHVVLQLRHHFLRLQREDQQLIYEGVENLKKHTLVEICKDRGMNFNTLEKEMILQIKQWLQLASIKEVPYILLLYIRCVIVTHSIMDIHDERWKQPASASSEKQVNASSAEEKEKLIKEAKEKLDDLKMKEEEIKKNINKETKDEHIEEAERSSHDARPHKEEIKQTEKEKGASVSEIPSPKKVKIDVLKHNKYMKNELSLLKQICDLQHKELKITFTSLTDLAEKKQSCDLNELIKTMAERISDIEKHISELNVHKQIEMDEYFYPEEDEEETDEKPDGVMNLKS